MISIESHLGLMRDGIREGIYEIGKVWDQVYFPEEHQTTQTSTERPHRVQQPFGSDRGDSQQTNSIICLLLHTI